MALTKKTRFTVFERDGFTCQYCGRKPPEIILNADHIVSRKDGGDDDIDNLITSCRDCNIGKFSKSLPKKPNQYKKKIADLKEKTSQLEGYYEYLKNKNAEDLKKLNIFNKAWQDSFPDEHLTDKGLRAINKLLHTYTADQIFEAIKITGEAGKDAEAAFPYMHGVLKNLKLKQDNPEAYEEKREIYKIRMKLMYKYPYYNDRLFWKWVNDGALAREININMEEAESWSNLKYLMEELLYEATN